MRKYCTEDKTLCCRLQIKAVDNGRPQLKETCRVLFTVVERPLQSPSRPRFEDGARRVTVMESDQVGHMVALVSANDADGDKIWYSIIGKCRLSASANLRCEFALRWIRERMQVSVVCSLSKQAAKRVSFACIVSGETFSQRDQSVHV